MARLFAKALNCEKGIGQQCNACSNCQAINEGNHPDVIEIDAASNNGVDQVRDLIDKVRYAPIKGRYKIYIIDEVHMEKDVTPLLNDKPSARFYFDMLSLAFQDIVAAKNGQPIKLASYANIIKDLAKKLPHVESSLLAIMSLMTRR